MLSKELMNKTKGDVINICRKVGYYLTIQEPDFFSVGRIQVSDENPILKAGVKRTDYVRFTDLTKGNDRILIIDVFDGWHSPLSDSNIIKTLLFVNDDVAEISL